MNNHPFPPDVSAFFSDRSKDVALPEKIARVRQVHGDDVVVISTQTSPEVRDADALITKIPGMALAIRTADCLPVFIYDPVKKGIGLVHAGWRGTQKQIVVKTVAQMQQEWGTTPVDLLIKFGPSIRCCCYEVGSEFEEIFPGEIRRSTEGLFLDLPAVNKNQLLACGVRIENIHDEQICTCCQKEFFSYRREGKKAGRHLSVMMMRE